MTVPVMAIVGRPNVGKSTLFNRLVGERMAIVLDRPGITRDRIYASATWLNRSYRVIDTGGLSLGREEPLVRHIRAQAELAIDEADGIVFVVDGVDGLTAADHEVADLLRRSGKAVVVAVNKLDNPRRMQESYEFYELGFTHTIGVSCAHGLGIGDLLEAFFEAIPAVDQPGDDASEDDAVKVAVIGRPNVGKSSFVNRLLGEERVLVSDVPGTTRDAVDTPLEYNGVSYILIDTAGVRKRGKIYEGVEKYSVLRALRAIERCDAAVVLLDATEGITEQDKHIAGFALDAGRATVLAVNKWDISDADERSAQEFVKRMRAEFPFMAWAPVAFVSALTGRHVGRVLELAAEAAENHAQRISTATVNAVIQDAILRVPPPTDRGKRLKVLYGTQVGVRPPTFVVFVNEPDLMHFSYERYLENQLREAFGFAGTPIRMYVRKRA